MSNTDEYARRHWIEGDISLRCALAAEDAGRGSVRWTRDAQPYWLPADGPVEGQDGQLRDANK